MIRALRYSSNDDVIVLLETANPGASVKVDGEDEIYVALDDIPAGHKMATCAIHVGKTISKSGQPIAFAIQEIRKGEHVHCHNIRGLIEKWDPKRILDKPMGSVKEIDNRFVLSPLPGLTGYPRKNGMVGFRNHLLVISTVVCANQIVQDSGYSFPEIAAITNPTGCLMLSPETERMNIVLLSLARNPNVGAVIFVGLGCETVDAEWFKNQIVDEKPVDFIRIQDEGSSEKAGQKLNAMIKSMLKILHAQNRVHIPFSSIRLGTKCGGSDWTTTVVSNPAIGMVSDYVVKNGGISLLGETMGWFGGEDMLLAKARTPEIASDIMKLMENIYRRAEAMGKHVDEGNPTPGNKAGGITTLNEKALGNVKKGGSAPIDGVLKFGEVPWKPGFYVTDNPGLDPISLLGLTCSSANVILFSTGRGTPTGTPIAPSIKLSGSPEACSSFIAHMDVDLSKVVSGTMTLEMAGETLLRELIKVCNGKLTSSEKTGHREFAFPLVMAPL